MNRSLQAPLDTDLLFQIDEWIDEESFKRAFFISPEPPSGVKFKFGLYKIRVSFIGGLEDDKTYVVTVGAGFKDLQRNSMAESYTFAFSTGGKLDHGQINGRIVSRKPGLIAALYRLDELGKPVIRIPPEEKKKKSKREGEDGEPEAYDYKGEYLTQTGEAGDFSFSYISPGDYRLIVFDDKNDDRIYTPGDEALGLFWRDLTVNEDTTENVIVNAVVRAAEPPAIRGIDAKDSQRLELILNRNLEFLPEKRQVSVVDTFSGDTLETQKLYRHHLDSARIVLETDKQDSLEYKLKINGGKDFWGEALQDSFFFIGNAYGDTLPPALTEYSAYGDSTFGQLNLVISEPVYVSEMLKGISLPDTGLTEIEIAPEIILPGKYSFTSPSFIMGDTIFFEQNTLVDKNNNRGADSTFSILIFPFEEPTLKEETGSVSGEIVLNQAEEPQPELPVVVIFISEGSEIMRESVRGAGKFTIESVPKGYYTFEAFIDADANGRYNYGLLRPFTPPERYTIADQDTFRVRAGWETAGIKIEFK